MRNESGFTLLEVMIGLAILAGVIFTVLTGLNYNLGVASYNKDLVLAATLGREKAEEVSLSGIPADLKGEFQGPLKRFSWKIAPADTEVPGLKRLNITVSWDRDKSVEFGSYHQVQKK